MRLVFHRSIDLMILTVFMLVSVSSGQAQTYVGGWINSDETWIPGGNPYIAINNISVAEGVTLTIEPGVEIQFDDGNKLNAHGNLIAVGTLTNPILFTSSQTSALPGDWGGIHTWATCNSSGLEHCIIEYGDSADLGHMIYWSASSGVFRNNIIRHGAQAGIIIRSDNPVFENNEVYGFSGTGAAIVGGGSVRVLDNLVYDC
ncbi:right-handed parallel beta-helix repeat-containing protein, partial [bacterium]|nr:right-handed parallel beta-helix repeat-containing protein [bacterium]